MMNKAAARAITKQLARSFVPYPRIVKIIERMEHIFKTDWEDEEPDNLFLYGESGVGKTRLLEKFSNMHPRIVHPEFTEIPVLYLTVPPSGNRTALTGRMLFALGSPYWDRGNVDVLTGRLMILLKACKVRIILLNEINHLVDKGGIKTHHLIGDLLKELAEAVRIPVVSAGIPRSKRLMETNDQFRGRFRETKEIRPFSVEDDESEQEFCNVLQSFSEVIVGVPRLDLTDGDLPAKIVFATAGRLRELRRLLVRMVEIGFDRSSPRIDIKTLAEAFRQVIYPGATDDRNPFCNNFKRTPLIAPGEPFAPREER